MDEKNSFSNPQFMSFQDFTKSSGDGQTEINLGSNQQHYDPTVTGMMEDLQGFHNRSNSSEQNQNNQNTKNFFTIEFYQKFFNVTTNDVLDRLKKSVIPSSVDNYLITNIRPNPDLYGPFWVCMTLIFSIGISGNIANYFQNSGNYNWTYNFHIVSQAATCIFLYAWLLPLILWATLNWFKGSSSPELIEDNSSIGLLELICLYGYSLSIYVPVAFLWTIQISVLQWALVIAATVLSGGVLVKSMIPIIPTMQKPIYVAVILGMHFILAVGFKEYFFHMPSTTAHPNILTSTTTVSSIVASVKNVALNVSKTAV